MNSHVTTAALLLALPAMSLVAFGSGNVPDEHFQMAWERHYGGTPVESNTVSVLETNTVDLLRLVSVTQPYLLDTVDAQAIYQVGKLTPNFIYEWTAMVIRDDEPTHLESEEEVLAFLGNRLDLSANIETRDVLTAVELFSTLRGLLLYADGELPPNMAKEEPANRLSMVETNGRWTVRCTLWSQLKAVRYNYRFVLGGGDMEAETVARKTFVGVR